MTTETKFRAGLAMSLLGLTIMTFEYFEKDRVYQELKISSSKQKDSLKQECEFKDNQIGKSEMALEMFREKNKKAADEYELIFTTQTE
jgi:hypothetical protein